MAETTQMQCASRASPGGGTSPPAATEPITRVALRLRTQQVAALDHAAADILTGHGVLLGRAALVRGVLGAVLDQLNLATAASEQEVRDLVAKALTGAPRKEQ